MMPWYVPLFLCPKVAGSQTSAICNDYVQQREQTSGVGGKTDGKINRSASKPKAGKSGHTSASKSIKSKVRKMILLTVYDSFPPFCRKLLQILNLRMVLIYPPLNAKRDQE